MKKKIYVGCSLTHAPQEFRDGIDALKVELRKHKDVLDFLGLEKGTPQDVFEYDTACVKNCDLLVAECSLPATGLGYELGTALALDKPVLAVAHRDAKVGRLLLGVTHPKYTFRRYDEMEEIVHFVKEKLEQV